ncbi:MULTISPECIES: hypothetical protein [Enterobacter]|uniref:hypothetical protein n=1 Tax=Enterobacter TaxID=547 RepID=UPI001260B7CE|nr:hypothetical protein [Enterobacter oligotrophicus]ELW1646391.1 hypothetical protein [Enterobacter oligotrophicus]MBT9425480.1 hypothetical protein [Enterobacter oligotrophicus]
MAYHAIKSAVYNRGQPTDIFLDELILWGKTAEDAIFEPNENVDIYSKYHSVLGPWNSLLHRKAVMLEVLRVLAGFESSWNWLEGRDVNNPEHSPLTTETGIFQVSANSMKFGDLEKRVELHFGSADPQTFINGMKQDRYFAIEYAARLLRITIEANGPILNDDLTSPDDRYLHNGLRAEAVEEFIEWLSPPS